LFGLVELVLIDVVMLLVHVQVTQDAAFIEKSAT
jgi:hypothetical protein